MISLNDVGKTYGKVTALQQTSLKVEPESTTVLIGPSGCGKSTILRLMIGLIVPDEGTVDIDGTTLTASTVLDLRRRIGYVIQDGGLFPHLTSEQNIVLMAKYVGKLQSEIDSRLNELSDLVHIPKETLSRYPHELSGGQRQRIGLMRALFLDPEILLLDEPLGALDPVTRSELQTELKSIFMRLKKTVVIVTHDMGEAAYFGSKIVLMRNGKIVQAGSLSELWNTPVEPFVKDFINAQRSPLEQLVEVAK